MKRVLAELARMSNKTYEVEDSRLVSAMVIPSLDGEANGAELHLMWAEEESLIVVPEMKMKEKFSP